MTKKWPPDLPPKEAHLAAQSLGVFCLVFIGWLALGLRASEPLYLVPLIVIYLWLQAMFHLSVRQAKRPIRARTFLFIA